MKIILRPRYLVVLTMAVLLTLVLLIGCGKGDAPNQAEEPPKAAAAQALVSNEEPLGLDAEPEEETIEEEEKEEEKINTEEELVAEPEPIKLDLEDAIVFPQGFTIEDVISVSEIEELVIDRWYYYYPKGTPDAAEKGKPIGGFKRTKGKGDSEIAFSVVVESSEEDFKNMRAFVNKDTLEELMFDSWDQAYIGLQTNGKSIVTILKDDVAMSVTWNPEFYSRYDNTELGRALAILIVNNLYGGQRDQVFISEKARRAATEIPDMDPSLLEGADPNLPNSLPADLKDATSMNKYAADLYFEYVGANIFVSGIASEADKASARKALKLIIQAEDKAIELYDKNESQFYSRGVAYAQLYYDSGHWAYRLKALEDLERAMEMGLEAAKIEFDDLRGK